MSVMTPSPCGRTSLDRRDLMTAMYSDVITTGLLASCWTPTPTGGIFGGPAGPPLEQATRAAVTINAPDKLSRRAWMKQRSGAMGKEGEASVKPQSYCPTRNLRFRVV